MPGLVKRTPPTFEHLRVFRSQILPELEEALNDNQLDEAGGLKKFGAAMRMVSLLKGDPINVQPHEPAPAITSIVNANPNKPAFMKDVVVGDGGPPKKKSGPQETPTARRAGLRKRA